MKCLLSFVFIVYLFYITFFQISDEITRPCHVTYAIISLHLLKDALSMDVMVSTILFPVQTLTVTTVTAKRAPASFVRVDTKVSNVK